MRTFRVWRMLVLAVLAAATVVVVAPTAQAATGPERIQAAWLKAGGATGPVGAPTSDVTCDLPDSGCTQAFEHGTYYNSFHTNSFYVMDDAIGAEYDGSGGARGRLGYPVGLAACPTGEVGCRQLFTGGVIAYSAATGAHAVLIHTGADGTGLEGYFGQPWTITLGYPTGDLSCTLTGGGCTQQFQHGASYQSPTPATYGHLMLDGAIRDYWLRAGAQDGPLGYPWSNTACDPSGQCYQRFEHGDIVAYSAATGVHAMPGDVAGRWWYDSLDEHALIPSHGMPIADAVCVSTNCTQEFQHATIWTPFPGRSIAIDGPIRDKWKAAGGPSVMGYPIGPQTCGLPGGGCSQSFDRNDTAFWSAGSGAHFLSPVIAPAWTALKGVASTLGYPTSDPRCGLVNDGCYQVFQGGTEVWSGQSGAHFVRGPIWAAWVAQGSERGSLSYPTTDVRCGLVNGGCYQVFRGGTEVWSGQSGAHLVRGPIWSAWAAQGSERGALGYPTSDPFCGLVRGGCGQHFQNGSIYWSPASGARIVRGAIRKAWAASGWERGRYGYPIGQPIPVAGGRFTQAFQYGRLTA